MAKEELILDGSEDAETTYRVRMHCTNCGNEQLKDIPLAITISKYEPICSRCLCRTLVEDR